MASKRKQDEKHLKMLREMVAQEANKKCFDCGQRGPTYVNMTIGSFVCTTCSGILRGLNPPHRVKSISMASYTPAEMESLQEKGNEFCRLVWLGLWDARSSAEPESKDEQKVKDFMAQKYERKRWYVPPEQAAALAAQQKQKNIASEVPEAKPLKQLLGKDTPTLQVQNHSQSPSHIIRAPVKVSQPPSQPQQLPAQPQPSKPSVDLLGELGGDPFGSAAFGSQPQPAQSGGFDAFGGQPQPPQQQSNFDPFGSGQQSQGGGFADFGSAFSQQQPASSAAFSQPAAPQPAAAFSGPSATDNPFGVGDALGPPKVPLTADTVTTSSANQPPIPAVFPPPPSSNTMPVTPHVAKSANIPAPQPTPQSSHATFQSQTQTVSQPSVTETRLLQPGQPTASQQQQNSFGPMVSSTPSAPSAQQKSHSDRYAALSELDTLFHDTSSSINWSGTPPSSSGGMFGSSGSLGSGGGGVSASSMSQSSSLGNMGTTSWAGGSTMTSSGSMGVPGAGGGSTNPFMATSAGTGFNQQGATTGFGQPAANPFLAQPSGTGFGQANGSYGQMTQANMGFGTQQAGMFGAQQQPQQAGGFGAQPAGGFGQQPAAGGFGMQQPGGFGQVGGQANFGGSMGGFGQTQQQPQQNLSFGGAGTAAMASNQFAKMGQPQQQQFGGWGQPAQPQQQMNMGVNPFMSGGQNQFAARNTSGNPFL
ncbi:arf-GAP domain and FG repeat-containing protein 1-like isoform X2 [Ptychodera flava]|uniref:arf-GAP domain and FG repeat-containing protein 1-like isoform X2 n=1 Tax=Ptychodera flava TaxID=63121 RepID=UPI00396A2724